MHDVGAPEDEVLSNLSSLKVSYELEGELAQVEVTPDRPDLLGEKGLAMALRAYLGLPVSPPETYQEITQVFQEEETENFRGHFNGFFVSGLNLDDLDVQALMNFQEVLHKSYCRDRQKASIGIHDASGVTRVDYVVRKLDQVRFIPLGGESPMTADEVLRQTEKGAEYGKFMPPDSQVGLFVMSNRGVMSMPPIINSEMTRVTKRTNKIFVDVEGSDARTVNLVAALLARELSGYGSIGLTRVNSTHGQKTCPDLSYKDAEVDVEAANSALGTSLSPEELTKALNRLGHEGRPFGNKVLLKVPYYRFDVLGPVDVIEDAMMGVGLQALKPTLPNSYTVGKRSKDSRERDKVRDVMAWLGYIEISMTVLTDGKKQKEFYDLDPLPLSNPVSASYDSLRIGLLPDLLRAIFVNKKKGMPLRFFEVGSVIEPVGDKAVQKLNVAAVVSDFSIGLEDVQGDLLRLCEDLGIDHRVQPRDLPFAITGRSGSMPDGWVAELSPKVLLSNGVEFPAAAFELSLGTEFVTKLVSKR